MNQASVRVRSFDSAGFYFVGLLIIAFLGFWKSYFSKFFTGTLDYSSYFHFHAVMMLLWTVMLIVQPILIRKKKLALHRLIGKVSYVVMPVMLISLVLILNAGIKAAPAEEVRFTSIIFPVRDFWFLVVFYTVAVVYKSNIHIHARAMIATGIVFIEPSLARFLSRMVFEGPVGAVVAWLLILALLAVLIIRDRTQKSGRWIFPAMMIVFILSYIIVLSEVQFPLLDGWVKWFGALPLT